MMTTSLAFSEEGAVAGPRYRVHNLPLSVDAGGSFPVRDYYLTGEPGRVVLSRDLALLDAELVDWVVASFATWFERRFWARTVSSAGGLVNQERDILRRLEAGVGTIQRPELITRRMSEIRKSQWLLAEFEAQLNEARAALAAVVVAGPPDGRADLADPSGQGSAQVGSFDRDEWSI